MKKIFYIFFFFTSPCFSQVLSNNGSAINISSGTIVKSSSFSNSSGTIINAGTITLTSDYSNSATTNGNGNYNVGGNWSNSGTFTAGTSTVTFNGAGAQTIGATTFSNVAFSGGNTKTLTGNINVTGNLTPGANTTVALSSYNIILKSTATATARVAAVPITAAFTYGSGKFIAERYIQGRRKYRLMTSPITTSTSATLIAGQESLSIWGNWQNQGNNITANVGTIITGGTSANGFDQQTTNASLYTYNEAGRSYTGFSTANGKNTKYTPLKAGIAYYMFVYGDRLNDISIAAPNYTVLSAVGTILTGDQTYNTASTIPLTNTVGNYTMLGNPFASPIDWSTITKTNLNNTFWGWDPNLSSTGGYVTVSTTGSVTLISPFTGATGLNQYIQSGQGFFVRTSAASPVLVIKESDKVSNNNTNAFRTTTNNIPLIAVNLFDNNTKTFIDGSVAAFSTSFSNGIGKEDAAKMTGSAEVIAIKNGDELLSIDARQMPQADDTISLKLLKLIKPQYTLQIFTNQLGNTNVQPYLFDSYLKTTQTLFVTDTNRIAFNVTSDASSFNPDRFKIVFSASNALPVIVNAVKTELKIFPNPIKNQQINFEINGLEKGDYVMTLINSLGQQTFLQPIIHQGGILNKSIYVDKKLSKGIYYLTIAYKNIKLSKAIFIE